MSTNSMRAHADVERVLKQAFVELEDIADKELSESVFREMAMQHVYSDFPEVVSLSLPTNLPDALQVLDEYGKQLSGSFLEVYGEELWRARDGSHDQKTARHMLTYFVALLRVIAGKAADEKFDAPVSSTGLEISPATRNSGEALKMRRNSMPEGSRNILGSPHRTSSGGRLESLGSSALNTAMQGPADSPGKGVKGAFDEYTIEQLKRMMDGCGVSEDDDGLFDEDGSNDQCEGAGDEGLTEEEDGEEGVTLLPQMRYLTCSFPVEDGACCNVRCSSPADLTRHYHHVHGVEGM